jgi:hypothetical protein
VVMSGRNMKSLCSMHCYAKFVGVLVMVMKVIKLTNGCCQFSYQHFVKYDMVAKNNELNVIIQYMMSSRLQHQMHLGGLQNMKGRTSYEKYTSICAVQCGVTDIFSPMSVHFSLRNFLWAWMNSGTGDLQYKSTKKLYFSSEMVLRILIQICLLQSSWCPCKVITKRMLVSIAASVS